VAVPVPGHRAVTPTMGHDPVEIDAIMEQLRLDAADDTA
jgi:hypothetical protein